MLTNYKRILVLTLVACTTLGVASGQVLVDFESYLVDPDANGPLQAGDAMVAGSVIDDAFAGMGMLMRAPAVGATVRAGSTAGFAVSGRIYAISVLPGAGVTLGIDFNFEHPPSGRVLTTSRFSLQTDRDTAAEAARLDAYDANGQLVATTGVVQEVAAAELVVEAPAIHRVVFTPVVGNPGMGIDNVRFEPLTAPQLADLNGDCAVDLSDLAIILGDFGCSTSCPGDVDLNGTTDLADLAILLANFGESC